MSRLTSLGFCLFSGGVILVGAMMDHGNHLVAQDAKDGAKGQTVKITTVDGVKLNAMFYPSSKENSPTVIMLHPIGDGKSMNTQEWKQLAEKLQAANYSVMMFDFRGHGESTSFDKTEFFKYAANKALMKQIKEEETLDVKDYLKSAAYLPVLVNDIAAVKCYLDRKNDDKACNTGMTIVIGADNGATLGAIWINSEWYRFKQSPPPNAFTKGELAKKPEGNDIIGAVFLTIQPNLVSTRPMNVSKILKNACKDHFMASVFFYGSQDDPAKRYAKTLETNLKTKNKKHDFTQAVEWNTNLSGVKLLAKALKSDDWIVKYLNNVVQDRENEWAKRDFENSNYYWRMGTQYVPAKMPLPKGKGEKNLLFDTYEKFAQ